MNDDLDSINLDFVLELHSIQGITMEDLLIGVMEDMTDEEKAQLKKVFLEYYETKYWDKPELWKK